MSPLFPVLEQIDVQQFDGDRIFLFNSTKTGARVIAVGRTPLAAAKTFGEDDIFDEYIDISALIGDWVVNEEKRNAQGPDADGGDDDDGEPRLGDAGGGQSGPQQASAPPSGNRLIADSLRGIADALDRCSW